MGIIDRHIERDINWEDVAQLDVLGLDEISLKKGHRDFVAIITGHIETETLILGVLPDRKKATVKAFLSGIPQRVRQTIHSVCSDMYEGFVNAAKEVFGKRVKIVIDRFHANNSADHTRVLSALSPSPNQGESIVPLLSPIRSYQ